MNQGVWWGGHKAFSRNGRCPFERGSEQARVWFLGFNFAKNVFNSKNGNFRGRFNEPREKGGPE